MAAAANMNGSRNASVPKTKMRMRSAIGIAMSTSPTKRSSAKTGSRSCSIAAWPETKTSRAGDLADRRPHVVGVALRVRRLEVGDDQRGDDGVRDRLDRGDLARSGARRRPWRPPARTGATSCCGRAGLAARDDRERPGRLLAELLLEDPLRPRGVRPGEREAVREQVREPRVAAAGGEEDHQPRPRERPSGGESSPASSAPSGDEAADAP